MITGVVVFNPPQGMGCDKGIGRKMQRRVEKVEGRGKRPELAPMEDDAVFKGPVFLGLPVSPVHGWKIVS